ncbi:hypothetical protein RJ639_039221 [Escallonia herrerae]|uniref:Uncharacterized protein n=1 Tax=Escallonia herrerae TaxID=1293975 RepID=A0AA88WKV1_9ASTE|nr:hypothetical protein RJ639_039221 [Escallonia herrerae]
MQLFVNLVPIFVGIELCERLSTMGIAVNLVTYLDGTMHLSSATSSTVVFNWGGTSFLLSLLGGILADSFLGRYWTIAIFATIHAMGTCILAISTVLPNLHPPPCFPSTPRNCKEANSLQMGVFFIALYSIAVGLGGIKSSVSGFGTDQFDQKDEKEKAQMAYFFNRFYFFISVGTLLAATVFVYIQDTVGRSWGYGICSALMFLAIMGFISGTRRYRYKKCVGSPIIHVLQVLVAATSKRKLKVPSSVHLLYENSPRESRICRTDQFCCLDKAAIITTGEVSGTSGSATANPSPWKLCSVTRVEEVKMMIRIMPIWATTIMFWTIHAQMITFAVQQAATMERSIGKFQVPAGSFNFFFTGSILITLGVYDRLVMPLWSKRNGNQGFTSLKKMGLGLFISIITMVVAAIVESRRLSVARAMNSSVSTLPISAFLLVPQFALAGAGEGFMYTGQLDFFITQSPKGMKAISTSLFLTTIALGFFVSSALVAIVKKVTGGGARHNWLPHNINNSRLDCFYGFIAVLNAVNLGLYLACAMWYRRKLDEDTQKMESDTNFSSRG